MYDTLTETELHSEEVKPEENHEGFTAATSDESGIPAE